MNAIVIAETVNASKFSEFNDPETSKPNSHNPAVFDGSPSVSPQAVYSGKNENSPGSVSQAVSL
jgi:hypothetical protein